MNALLAMPTSAARSLRTRFALVMGISGLLFGFFATGFLEWRLEQETSDALHRSLQVTANEIANRLANDLAARKREIELTGSLLQKAGLSAPADLRSLFDELKRKQPSYAWIGLTDASGEVLAATGGLLEGQNVAARPWFDGARNGAYLGDPHEAKLLAKYIGPAPDGAAVRFVDVAISLKDRQGRLQGVLAAHLHWYWVKTVVTEMLNELDSGIPVQVLVADRHGVLLLKPDSEPATSLSELQPGGRPDPAFLVARADGVADDLSRGLGWSVLARQEMRQIQAPIQSARNLMLLLSLGVGVAFIGLTWLLSGRVARPIKALADEAHAYSPRSGQPFQSEIARRADEVGVLGRIIENLVDGLLLHAARAALFIEHAPVPLVILDTEMRYVAASRRWLADFGLEGRTLAGLSHYAVLPETPPAWRQIHQRALAGEVLHSDREHFVRADGSSQWLRWEVRPWRTPAGQIGGIAIFSEEITQRVEAEQALEESQTRFQATFEQAAVGIAHVGIDGRWLRVNQKLCDILGYPRDELLCCTFQDITHPDDLEKDLDNVRRMLARDIDAYSLEKRYLRKEGAVVWIQLTVALVWTPEAHPDYFISVVEDISARKRTETALDASRQRFAGIVSSAMDAIISIDSGGRIVLFNDAAQAMFRVPAHQALGSPLERLLPERFRAGHAAHVARFGSAGRTSRAMGALGEIWGVRSDGEEFPIEAAISQVAVGGEKLYTVILRDISARLAAEREIREREALFRGFFEASSVGSAVLDPHGRYVAVNDCYCAMLGYRREELLNGMGPLDLTHPDDLVADRERVGRLLRGEADYDVEKRFLGKTGALVWSHVSAKTVRNAAGEIEAIVGVAQDITLRRQAAAAMRDYQADLEAAVAERTQELLAARNYFRDFVLRAPLPLCVIDAEGRIVVRNEQFVRLFGYPESAVPTLAEWWLTAYPDPAYRASVRETWSAAVAQAQAAQQAIPALEYRVTCADGTERQVEISGVTLEAGFLVTFVDVTVRHQVESELRMRRAEADAANQAKSEFLSTMSHEIRTPINAILGSAQILERADLPEDEHQLVGTIRTAGRSLLAIINDVLDLSKIEAGHFELDHSPFVLGNVMSNLIDVYTASARNKGLALTLSPLPGDVDALIGDAYRLGQVLHNLLGNAIKFTAAGQISLSVAVLEQSPRRARVRFSVRDSGIGIPAERLPHLFQAFVQAEASTSRHFGGTGLGLAICRQLVTLMGGEIGVESEPGRGSEFWFVAPFEKSATGRVAAPSLRAPAAGTRLAGRHLLVVDDSPVNLELARRLLVLEGARCDTASDGRRALARLREQPGQYDLVLMDVQMPGMDGLEATQAIRGELGLSALPVIALTAGALPSQRERASAAGMNDFLTKPFELDTLVAAILRHLDGRPSRSAPPLPPPAPSALPASDFPSIAGIDSAQAAQRMLGDRDLFYSSLRALRNEFGTAPAQMRAELAADDRHTAARRMHKLRGVAGNLSALRVAALAAELEQGLDSGALALEPPLTALAEALDEVLSDLPADLDAPDSGAADSAELEPAELEALREALAEYDMKALRLYASLRPRLAARHGEAAMGPLNEAIEQLDFGTAWATLRAWHPPR